MVCPAVVCQTNMAYITTPSPASRRMTEAIPPPACVQFGKPSPSLPPPTNSRQTPHPSSFAACCLVLPSLSPARLFVCLSAMSKQNPFSSPVCLQCRHNIKRITHIHECWHLNSQSIKQMRRFILSYSYIVGNVFPKNNQGPKNAITLKCVPPTQCRIRMKKKK